MDEYQNLMFGSSGRIVIRLKAWLTELLRLNPPLDGSPMFDLKTQKALEQFQKANGITVNRNPVVGFDTWKAIGKKLGQVRIFNDPDLPAGLKIIMAADVIATPGQLQIDRPGFFFLHLVRFGKKSLDGGAQANLDQLLGFMEADANVSDLRWFAYMLATTRHEAGPDYLPRSEGGCNDTTGCTAIVQNGKTNNRDYGRPRACPNLGANPPTPCPAGRRTHTYYGRGYVQLTHDTGYALMAGRTGVDLIHFPERAMLPNVAYQVMSIGMRGGLFTGHSLGEFISGTTTDYRSARQIVNPLDTSTFGPIAATAKTFEEMLEASVRR